MRVESWPGLTPYEEGVRRMEMAVTEVLGGGEERVFVCQHNPVLTVGSSGKTSDIMDAGDVPVVGSGRGGKVTYHGPGQIVVYPIVKLTRFRKDVRVYVRWLQAWLIDSLSTLGIDSFTTDDIGVWVRKTPESEPEKVAAIGVRVRRGIAFHGISLNVTNNMDVYQRFIPCGLSDKGVARIKDLRDWPHGDEGLVEVVESVLVSRFLEVLPDKDGDGGA